MALALKRVSEEAGRLGCWEVYNSEEISSRIDLKWGIGIKVLHRELRET